MSYEAEYDRYLQMEEEEEEIFKYEAWLVAQEQLENSRYQNSIEDNFVIRDQKDLRQSLYDMKHHQIYANKTKGKFVYINTTYGDISNDLKFMKKKFGLIYCHEYCHEDCYEYCCEENPYQDYENPVYEGRVVHLYKRIRTNNLKRSRYNRRDLHSRQKKHSKFDVVLKR